ncbi:carbohydrate ABC transporter permease [Alicyclobacillus curvatus]|nr:carbohydrate ABC transporter permease [Alicyclobacillus curvatus]
MSIQHEVNVKAKSSRALLSPGNLLDRAVHILGWIMLVFWLLFTIVTMLWLIASSLKSNQQFFGSPFHLPSPFKPGNYARAWSDSNMSDYFIRSVAVDVLATAASVVISIPAAYVLSRSTLRISRWIVNGFAVGIGIPIQIALVPLYVALSWTHLLDSMTGLGLVYVGMTIPLTVFLLTGFLSTIPTDLEEAARVDGASFLGTLFKIIVPTARNGIATAFIVGIVGLWNEFIVAYTVLTTQTKFTLPVGIYSLYGSLQYTSDWTGLMAAFVITTVPILIAFAVLSRQIISGLTLGVDR